MEMMITDLDGTLLKKDNSLSVANKDTLFELKKFGIVRVVATGRSLYSALKVMDMDFPIDYLIFSTGAGIIDWKSKEIFYRKSIDSNIVFNTVKVFLEHDINFMLHEEIPDNHYFYYYKGLNNIRDYELRLNIYSNYARPFINNLHNKINATQIISVMKFQDEWTKLKSLIDNNQLSYIKTTSPLDGVTIWMEIFAHNVNKGSASEYLVRKLKLNRKQVVALGNDWNDTDLIEWCGSSYLVDNAPELLKKSYKTVKSNEEDGFAEAVYLELKK